jgi:hypothetical protein
VNHTEDIPASQPDFDFDRIADTLVNLLERKRSGSFVLGLHGPWGSGKTTLLNAIRSRLPSTSIIVDFNAWKYQDREALWRALILRVLAALRDAGGDPKLILQLERSLYESFTIKDQGSIRVNWTGAMIEAVLLAVSLSSAGLAGGLLGGIGQKIRGFLNLEANKEKNEDVAKRIERVGGILQRETIERSIQHVVSIEQFLSLFRDTTAQLKKGCQIYVLVDDLDRCLPDSALEVFEAAKLFLDAPECAYVMAVDRAVIRRGLELRYPARMDGPAPPVVDPDEYIEKTISLSFDLPILAEPDALRMIQAVDLPIALSPDQLKNITGALGTNPRRLKRFSAMIEVWLQIAQDLRSQSKKHKLKFSPLDVQNLDMFLKVALIGYANSDLIAHMYRDDGLAERMQEICNATHELTGEAARDLVRDSTKGELPAVRQAALDPRLWRIFALPPNLSDNPAFPDALRWFRNIETGGTSEGHRTNSASAK